MLYPNLPIDNPVSTPATSEPAVEALENSVVALPVAGASRSWKNRMPAAPTTAIAKPRATWAMISNGMPWARITSPK